MGGYAVLPADWLIQVLSDFNDWAALDFTGIHDTDGGANLNPPQIVTEQPVPAGARHH
jgi:hypothetical protein